MPLGAPHGAFLHASLPLQSPTFDAHSYRLILVLLYEIRCSSPIHLGGKPNGALSTVGI